MSTVFSKAMEEHSVQSRIVDIDYNRSLSAFGAVETSFIIKVQPTSDCHQRCRFKSFCIEKSFHSFRNLVNEFKAASSISETDIHSRKKGWSGVPESTQNLIAFSDAFSQVIESEPISSYIGKMTFDSVKALALRRRKILDHALRVLTENYPETDSKDQAALKFKRIVSEFFLTDVVDEGNGNIRLDAMRILESQSSSHENATAVSQTRMATTTDNTGNANLSVDIEEMVPSENLSPRIVPKSVKKRLSPDTRRLMTEELKSRKTVAFHEENMITRSRFLGSPISIILVFVLLMQFFLLLPRIQVTFDIDVMIILLFSAFTIGTKFGSRLSKTVDQNEIPEPHRARINSETLMKKSLGRSETPTSFGRSIFHSIVGTSDHEEEQIQSSLKKFPDDAVIGSMLNCWSEPIHDEFNVRGANYLKDRIKFPSKPFLFPLRGVEVFLSDNCPENIGRYKVLLQRKLREKPTMLVNYRLPWGNVITYSEIPEKFLPFLNLNPSSKPPSMKGMSPAEICVCRFLMGSDEHKSKTLKIVPKVVKGPWIVKKTCDAKPAIVGTKMPTHYFYDAGAEDKAPYFEVDLDIVASSAARGILHVAQRYTKSLTLDLGFVLQGVSPDELPEQMLTGARLHGLDPVTAPMLPEMFDDA